MSKPILNLDEVELAPMGFPVPDAQAARFGASFGQIGTVVGAQKLGYNLTVVPAGKRAFPLHNHRVNEEMFFILEGRGEVRIGTQTHPIRRGDVIACPPGGVDTAHQIINTGDSDLRYLAVSTKMSPEICDYPDSGKFGVMAIAPGADGKPDIFRYVSRPGTSLDYWDGE
ncbi:cupin domain-containing protein [Arenimonas oryziterrae]|uniref:Cupin type-2 domain-containing protein n=1 Tax=Arenimonas oryziterrae DSM 21050 = YC6267 TaxID=1121015 RepID=A0A091ANX6_9GAMM|nr:cupin domain-containing protein [Arenimonas oryziterrae]KFN41071.1 hypothetical protein N789_04080 [Arenimonas oryziterrae DSM 21050 = YC6267]